MESIAEANKQSLQWTHRYNHAISGLSGLEAEADAHMTELHMLHSALIYERVRRNDKAISEITQHMKFLLDLLQRTREKVVALTLQASTGTADASTK